MRNPIVLFLVLAISVTIMLNSDFISKGIGDFKSSNQEEEKIIGWIIFRYFSLD